MLGRIQCKLFLSVTLMGAYPTGEAQKARLLLLKTAELASFAVRR